MGIAHPTNSTLPTDKYRRLMKTRFNLKAFRGRSHWSRFRDMFLRVITHNIMLVQ